MNVWDSLLHVPKTPLTLIPAPICREKSVQLWIKREDRLQLGDDLGFCGNKWRKLKYNLLAARAQRRRRLLTFGGAFSNHIAATAAAGRLFGFQTVGLIRGRPSEGGNATLRFARAADMTLHFIDRQTYRKKNEPAFSANLNLRFGDFYLIPEGGSNALALQGCRELGRDLAAECPERPLFVALSCGTGGTLAGLTQGLPADVSVLGFSALKGSFLTEEIEKLLALDPIEKISEWAIVEDYHFGGFAKFKPELIDFINLFKNQYGIPLDPVYTGKLLFGLLDLIKKDYFPKGARIVAVHSGGLQGIRGFNERFGHLLV